ELGPLGSAPTSQASRPDASVGAAPLDHDKAGLLKRTQQPAEVAGVQLEPGPQRAHVDAVAADFPEHPRPPQRQATGPEPIVKCPDPQREDPVEAAHLADHLLVYSLTIVRE